MLIKLLCATLLCTIAPVCLANLCPCEDQTLCNPIEYDGKEVYAFVGESNRTEWTQYDWTRITTIALFGWYDPELMCHAHKNKARVVGLGVIPKADLTSDDKVDKWIADQLSYAKERFLDGINIDVEYDIDAGSPEVDALTRFMGKVRDRFHQALPHSQVTFDVPWSPYNVKGTGIDGRNYNFTALADVSDFLFVMAYDERSQVFDTDCLAQANSDLFWTAGGLMAYLKLGVDPDKMVLGLPWYGYDYQCVRTGPDRTCFIKEVPFRNVSCSDAAGVQVPYVEIKHLVDIYGDWYDEHSTTRYAYFNDSANVTHQIWYDTSGSLGMKVGLAKYRELRGVGVWNANMLDYSGTKEGKYMVADMWGTFPEYKANKTEAFVVHPNHRRIYESIRVSDFVNVLPAFK